MIADVKLIINGRTWRFVDCVEGLMVSPGEGDDMSENFVVCNPLTRTLTTPGDFNSTSLGNAILAAMECEEVMGRNAAPAKRQGKGGAK